MNLSRDSINTSGGITPANSGQNGASVTAPIGQPGISVNIPQYSKLRFYTAFHANRSMDVSAGSKFYDEAKLTVGLSATATPGTNTQWPMANIYYSAGVDFQPLFFMCTPRLFDTGTLPNPGVIT